MILYYLRYLNSISNILAFIQVLDYEIIFIKSKHKCFFIKTTFVIVIVHSDNIYIVLIIINLAIIKSNYI